MEMIDNVNHLLGDDLKQTIAAGSRLKIAAAQFSIHAYEALKAELEQVESLSFIFTAPSFSPSQATDRLPKEPRQFHIQSPQAAKPAPPATPKARNALAGTEFEIQLRNRLTQKAIARECADWIRRKARFKHNATSAQMQPFICLETPQDPTSTVAYTSVDGFTSVDLGYARGNAISQFVLKNPAPVSTRFLSLFDQLWQNTDQLDDVTQQVLEHLNTVYRENAPESIYFLMLYNIFSAFLDDLDTDTLPNDRTGYQNTLIWKKLFNYQKDAATGLINKLETFNGCILADSVGLGKTFTALAVIKYYELRNRSVLVLCPKKLADNWRTYNQNLTTNLFHADRFNYDVLCHTDLTRTRGESFGIPLDRVNWSNYDLVVIDESHNFRNNDAYKGHETRYQKLMNRVIREGVKTKVLMLSATPVNNRFNDLRNQLALAYEGHSDTLSQKLGTRTSIEEVFRNAQSAFSTWSKLPPGERTAQRILGMLDFDFFNLLDNVTIARSRRHIQTYYDTKDIGPFPQRRKPLSFRCGLTDLPGAPGFSDISTQLACLRLSVYAPVSYILPSRLKKYEDQYDTEVSSGGGKLRQADREKSLQALMTVNLLKRLESSVHAFRLTLQSLQAHHRSTLDKIAAFHQRGTDSSVQDLSSDLESLEQDEDNPDTALQQEHEIGRKIRIHLADMDTPSWEHDLKQDLAIIDELLQAMQDITPKHDAKLQHLKQHLLHKVANPINPGNRKVLVFTAFADTADYLYAQLAPEIKAGQGLHTAKVTGSASPKSTLTKPYDFQQLLTLFSPRAKSKANIPGVAQEPADIDLLIATDCISEGQNLQDCDYLINYDIHWNPVRIIQRFGRVDRIGSPNQSIQLVNYWPDISLDEYINLKERVESRMTIADLSATGDDNIISDQAHELEYRKTQLQRLQNDVIELEDLKTGVSITDLGLNDFRMDLLEHLRNHPELPHLPNGLHAVLPANPAIGLEPGVIFALRQRALRGSPPGAEQPASIGAGPLHNRLHPYYLIHVDPQGQIIHDHTEPKRLLDLIRAACKGQNQPFDSVCEAFNQVTADGRNMETCSALLDHAIRSIRAIKEEKDIDSLFSTGPTTALTHTIQGLDDFELIAFLVIREVA